MRSVLHYIQILAAAVLLGQSVFVSFVVAPVLARTLDPEPFGRVVRTLFPAYYAVGTAVAAVGIAVTSCLALLHEANGTYAAVWGLWVGVLTITLYCRLSLTPRINMLRDALKEQASGGHPNAALQASWDRLHRRSVQLNSVVLGIGMCLMGLV